MKEKERSTPEMMKTYNVAPFIPPHVDISVTIKCKPKLSTKLRKYALSRENIGTIL